MPDHYIKGTSGVFRKPATVPGGGGGGGGGFGGAATARLAYDTPLTVPPATTTAIAWDPALTTWDDLASTLELDAGNVFVNILADCELWISAYSAFSSAAFDYSVGLAIETDNGGGDTIDEAQSTRPYGTGVDAVASGLHRFLAGDRFRIRAFQTGSGDIYAAYGSLAIIRTGGSSGSSSLYGGTKTLTGNSTTNLVAGSLTTGGGTNWDDLGIISAGHFVIAADGLYEQRLLMSIDQSAERGLPWGWFLLMGLGSTSLSGGETAQSSGGVPWTGVPGFTFPAQVVVTSLDHYKAGDIPDATIWATDQPIAASTFTINFTWTITKLG